MKKLTAIIAAFLLLFTVSGCSQRSATLEIKHRLIIQAIGIDTAENGKIRLSAQTLNTDLATNASGNSTPEKTVNCYTVEGATLTQCVEALRLMTGKNPLLSQNRIVIFSSALAKDGIGQLLDSFIRNNENRFNVYAALSKGEAQEIIKADLGENIVGGRLTEHLIENSQSETVRTKIYEIVNCVLDANKSAVLPVLGINENGIAFVGAGVFKGDRLAFTLTGKAIKGINFINNAVPSGTLNTGNISLDILKSRTAVKTKLVDGAPRFEIKVSASLVLGEIAGSINDTLDTDGIVRIKEHSETEIKNCIQTALDKCIIEGGADAFGLTRRVWRNFPDWFRENENEALKNADYEIEVNVKIVRTGDSVIKL